MTSKEKLRVLVDRLPEREAAALLAQLERSEAPRWPRRLSFTAVGRSGRHDLSARSAQILREEFPSA